MSLITTCCRFTVHKYLIIASHYSVRGSEVRRYRVGAVGRRSDGTLVYAWNGAVEKPTPCMHAEARLVKKLDYGSTVYVARTSKENGRMVMARPCANCYRALKNKGVKRVEYTISDNEYGVITFD